jgi:hypothetical protein
VNIDPSAVLAVISTLAGQIADVEQERDQLRKENELLRAAIEQRPGSESERPPPTAAP